MRWLIRLIAVAVLFFAAAAYGDSWIPATRTSYLSPDKATRFTVIPRELSDRLSYFTDKVDGKEPAGQRLGGETRATGILERRRGTVWTKIWQAELVNDVAPVRALVANGGAYVVTFDNWHSLGLGDNVVVIYRADGTLLRSMKLTDILPDDYVRALPTSVSSRWWSGEHVLSRDGRQLVLKVVVPSGSGSLGLPPRGYVDVRLDLATGTVAPLAGASWVRAMAAAAPLAARSKAEEAAWRMRMIAPLASPSNDESDEWTRYIYQAARRLAPEALQRGLSPVWLLPSPGTPEHAERLKDIRKVFNQSDEKDDFAFASPSAPAALARVLIDSASTGPAGRLAGSRLFVALPRAFAAEVDKALSRSGATVIMFDPTVPIPQLAEQLRKIGVAPEQAQEEASRAAADVRRYTAEAVRLDALAPPEPKQASADTASLEEMTDNLEVEAAKTDGSVGSPSR